MAVKCVEVMWGRLLEFLRSCSMLRRVEISAQIAGKISK